jgi:hypothetical protein
MSGVKLKRVPVFPRQAIGGAGIDVEKRGGNFTISLDYAEFGLHSPYVPQPNHRVVIFAQGSNGYFTVPTTVLIAATTWSPSDKSANIALSNSNLTATTTSATLCAVRSTSSHTSGKWYVEFTTGDQAGTDTGVGLATSSANLSTIGSVAAGGFISFGDTGTIYFNGSATGLTTGFIGSNTIVCMAIDLVNSKGWFRETNHNWNNNPAANPATNTNGIDISALFPSNAAFLVYCSNTSGSATTINVGGSLFTYTAPSGFSAWG